VAGEAARAGDDGGEARAVEARGVAGQQLARDQDHAVVALPEAQLAGAAGQRAQELVADVAQVRGGVAVRAGGDGREPVLPLRHLVAHGDLGVHEVVADAVAQAFAEGRVVEQQALHREDARVARADLLLDALLHLVELLARRRDGLGEPALLDLDVALADRQHGHVHVVLRVEHRRAHGEPGRHGQARHDQLAAGARAARAHAPSRAAMSAGRSAAGTRSCVMLSRSRTVTVPSFTESPSTVTHHGVPTSSCRR
jgi:hypothetical protein